MSSQYQTIPIVSLYYEQLATLVQVPANSETMLELLLTDGMVPLQFIDVPHFANDDEIVVKRTQAFDGTNGTLYRVAHKLDDILTSAPQMYSDMLKTAQVLWYVLLGHNGSTVSDPHLIVSTRDGKSTELSEPYIRHRYKYLLGWLPAAQQDHVMRYLQALFRGLKGDVKGLLKAMLMTAIDAD